MCTFHPQVQHLENKYDVLTETSTRTHTNKYVYLLKQVRVLTETSTTYTLITCILHYSLPKYIGLFQNLAWLPYMKEVSVSQNYDTLTLFIRTFAKKVLSFIRHEDYSLIMLNSSSAAARGPSLVFSGIASEV